MPGASGCIPICCLGAGAGNKKVRDSDGDSDVRRGGKRSRNVNVRLLICAVITLAAAAVGVGIWLGQKTQAEKQQRHSAATAARSMGGPGRVGVPVLPGDNERLNFQVVVTLPASSPQAGCAKWFDNDKVCALCCRDHCK